MHALILPMLFAGGSTLKVDLDAKAKLGADLNVFRTPSTEYPDPETGETEWHAPTRSPVMRTDVKLKLRQQRGALRLGVRDHFENDMYLSAGNANNANGFVNRAKAWVATDARFEEGWSRKLSIEGGLSTHWRNYRFLHRGTGEERKTMRSGIDQPDRFRFFEYGVFGELKLRTRSHTTLALLGEVARRDYRDIQRLSEFDFNLFALKASLRQKTSERTHLSASYQAETWRYLSRKPRNARGDLVSGELRRYLHHRLNLHFYHSLPHRRLVAGLKLYRRRDTYQDYWSYTEVRGRLGARLRPGRVTWKLQVVGFSRRFDMFPLPNHNFALEIAIDRRSRYGGEAGLEVYYDLTSQSEATQAIHWQLTGSVQAEVQSDDLKYYSYSDALAQFGLALTM